MKMHRKLNFYSPFINAPFAHTIHIIDPHFKSNMLAKADLLRSFIFFSDDVLPCRELPFHSSAKCSTLKKFIDKNTMSFPDDDRAVKSVRAIASENREIYPFV